jgi:hypothetical protein
MIAFVRNGLVCRRFYVLDRLRRSNIADLVCYFVSSHVIQNDQESPGDLGRWPLNRNDHAEVFSAARMVIDRQLLEIAAIVRQQAKAA